MGSVRDGLSANRVPIPFRLEALCNSRFNTRNLRPPLVEVVSLAYIVEAPGQEIRFTNSEISGPLISKIYSPFAAVAMVSRSLAADVVTGSSSTSSTLPRTFFPKTAFHGGMTIWTVPVASAWQARRMKGFSVSGWLYPKFFIARRSRREGSESFSWPPRTPTQQVPHEADVHSIGTGPSQQRESIDCQSRPRSFCDAEAISSSLMIGKRPSNANPLKWTENFLSTVFRKPNRPCESALARSATT